MDDISKKELSNYRIEMADEHLRASKVLLDNGFLKYSKYLMNAFQIRNHADYADYYVVAKDDAEKQYDRAKEFCEAIKKFVDEDSSGQMKGTKP